MTPAHPPTTRPPALRLVPALLLVLLGCVLQATRISAFVVVRPALGSARIGTSRVRRAAGVSMEAAPTDEELVKVFGRLADKALYLDESAGQCCHSGCDNCEWRYDFDVMRAARPKWLVTYQERKFDSGSHRAKWKALFDAPAAAAAPVSDEDLYGESGTTGPASLPSAQALADRLAALPFAAPLGPSVSVDGADPLAPETVAWLWEKLLGGGKSPVLTARLMEKRLKEWAKGGDSLMWGDFQRVVTQPATAKADA